MLCERCGTELRVGDSFCTSCGDPITAMNRNNQGVTPGKTPIGSSIREESGLSEQAVETAWNFVKHGRYGDALSACERAATSGQNSVDLATVYSGTLIAMRRYYDAEAFLKNEIEKYPGEDRLYYNYVILMLSQMRTEDALSVTERAVEAGVDNSLIADARARIAAAGALEQKSDAPEKTDGYCLASVVLGAISICLPTLGILPGILAIVFSIIGMKNVREDPGKTGRRLAIEGLVCGIFGILVSIGAVIAMIVILRNNMPHL